MDAGGLVCDVLQSFVRPVGNPQLTTFCTELTAQADIDTAPSFAVVADHLRGMVGSSVVCWASWGNGTRRNCSVIASGMAFAGRSFVRM
jgi:inhibitor of KinA sporulation pathway (predicted exonuclease)